LYFIEKLNLSIPKLTIKDEKYEPERTPQETATSPVLSTLYLKEILCKENRPFNTFILMYADDNLIFNNSKEEVNLILNELNKVVKVSLKKSFFVKENCT
jgi:hypothetical protein